MPSSQALIAVLWVVFALAACVFAGSLLVKARRWDGFFVEDYLSSFALLSSIVFSVTLTLYVPSALQSSQAAHEADHQQDQPDWSFIYRQHALVLLKDSFFWVTVYSVKFSILALYRRLFIQTHVTDIVWHVVAIGSFAALWASIGLDISQCQPPHELLDVGGCDTDPATQGNFELGVWIPTGLHCISNVAILSLPVWYTRKLALSGSEKVGFVVLMLAAYVWTGLDLARAVLFSQIQGNRSLVDEHTICEILEPQIAIILLALVGYRRLLDSTSPTAPPSWPRDRNQNQAQAQPRAPRPSPAGRDARQRSRQRSTPRSRSGHRSRQRSATPGRYRTCRSQSFEDQMSFIQGQTPMERRFYRLWLQFLDRQQPRHETNNNNNDDVEAQSETWYAESSNA